MSKQASEQRLFGFLRLSLGCEMVDIVLVAERLVETACSLVLIGNAVLLVVIVALRKDKVLTRNRWINNEIATCDGVILDVFIKGYSVARHKIQLYVRVRFLKFFLQFDNADILHTFPPCALALSNVAMCSMMKRSEQDCSSLIIVAYLA